MAGSCKSDICANLKPSNKISELDSTINDALGYSLCIKSCGSSFCGCFSFANGCLFYRI